MIKLLIVGGTGFLGYHLANRCIKKGWRVTSLSTNPPVSIRKVKKVKYILCDITKKKNIKKKLSKIKFDYVVNFGGYVNHYEKKKTYISHYNGCKNLADYFLEKKIKKFIQFGSSVEYGLLKSPQKESSLINQKKLKSTYGLAKFKATKLLINYYKKFNFPVTVFRLYLAYGPKQDINRFLPIVINACIKKKSFKCSDGTQLRDFIYVEDLIDAILKCLALKKKTNGKILNLGSGKAYNLKKIILFLVKAINGGTPEFGSINLRKDEIKKIYPNMKKTFSLLNWKPKTTLKCGLLKSIKYYKNFNKL